MTVLRYDVTIDQGSDYQLTIPVLDDAGQPATVDGYLARAQIRRTAGDPAVLHSFTDSGGGLFPSGSTVTWTVPASVSTAWAFRHGVYDLELVDNSGATPATTRLAEGRVVVNPETTR